MIFYKQKTRAQSKLQQSVITSSSISRSFPEPVRNQFIDQVFLFLHLILSERKQFNAILLLNVFIGFFVSQFVIKFVA